MDEAEFTVPLFTVTRWTRGHSTSENDTTIQYEAIRCKNKLVHPYVRVVNERTGEQVPVSVDYFATDFEKLKTGVWQFSAPSFPSHPIRLTLKKGRGITCKSVLTDARGNRKKSTVERVEVIYDQGGSVEAVVIHGSHRNKEGTTEKISEKVKLTEEATSTLNWAHAASRMTSIASAAGRLFGY